MRAAKDEHSRVRLEALAAGSWLGGDAGAEIMLTVAEQKTDRWIRNAMNSAMPLLKSNIEALVASNKYDRDSVSVDYDQLIAGKLEGAMKPKDFRTKKLARFKDKNFKKKYALGERVFYEEGSCYTCHRDHGEGIARIYPPLAGSEWALGDPERLTKLTLHGVWGKIRARGKIFEPTKGVPPMTAVGNMFSDSEVAAVLSYVRSSWGNDASEINAGFVKKVRAATKTRRKFYSPEELLEMHPFPEGSRPPLIKDAPPNIELENKLIAEPLSALAADAVSKGDAIRGAKLFYGEKAACATCHDSRADFQLGPELTVSRTDITNEHLIKSILQPSADILKGYQSMNVITDDGTIVSGFLVEEDDDKIVLSISAEKGKRREIPQDEVDDAVMAKASTMPSGLAATLKSRQEFLDLARFVIDVNQGGKKKQNELKRKAKVQSK